MKNILLASLFAVSAFGLQSCNNGDYDVNPAVTASGTNPLNTGNGGNGGGGNSGPGTANKGEIRFTLNGANYTLTGNYIDGNPRIMSGGYTYTGGQKQVGFIIDNYTGPATFTITETSNRGRYTIYDYTATPISKDYLTSNPGGNGQIIVTSDANNEMIGTFNFTAFNGSDQVTLTNGSFDLPKM
jgi:hypothetical protein